MSEEQRQGLRDNYSKFWSELTRTGDPEQIHNKLWVGFRAGWEAAQSTPGRLEEAARQITEAVYNEVDREGCWMYNEEHAIERVRAILSEVLEGKK